jgi:hypothetical protein
MGMPRAAVIDGLKIELGKLTEAAFGVYNVHRDPGIWMVLIGAVILALGMLWALVGYLGFLPRVFATGQ